MIRTATALGLALLLAGCHAPPPVAMAPAQSDEAGKRFDPPPPGMAAVYFYGRAPDNAAALVDGRFIGAMNNGAWVRVDVPAGAHEVACALEINQTIQSDAARADRRNFWTRQSSRHRPLNSGETIFLEIGAKVSIADEFGCTLAEIPTASGRAEVLKRRRAAQE